MSEFKQTNQFAKAVSSIPAIVDNYLASKVKDAVDVAIQLQSNKLKEEAQAKNEEFLKQIDSNVSLQDHAKGKEVESSKEPTHKESKSISSSKGASRSHPKSLGKSAQAKEHGQKVDDLEEHSHQEFNTGNDDATPIRETVDDRSPQTWITQLAQAAGTQSSFNEFLATPIDFSAFIMNRLKIENLTQDVLTGPTYDLMKGTPYPHDLSKPLPLIPNARGRQVIPFDHFINNNLEYLKEGSLSQRYTTSITKTKTADYGHVKWIADKVPGRIWSLEKVVYDKHAYSGTYQWVTSLKIMQFFSYSHLEEIIVRRQDDQLYKFREGDFKRLRRQDIEDMLLLLVQDVLSFKNLWKIYNWESKATKRRSTYLRKMTSYTTYLDIQGIIYQDDINKNRLMRTEELHKFSDDTLNHVRTTLNDIATGIQMDYLPRRNWSKQDKQRVRVMINAIDKKLRDQT
ncbi:hypothetical protein Tco_0797540 [Tanacetum coccineum]